MDKYILGIDLGTTNSVISYWDSNSARPEAIDVSGGFGKVPLPSVVQFRADENEWVVGEEAFRSAKIYPESTVQSIKRHMGTDKKVRLCGKDYLPEEISAKILHELINHATDMNPHAEMAGLVVSVPYDFDDAAQKATIKACELAGLSDYLICLIKEPNAAALAYSTRHKLVAGEKIMVFDFGGGTLDITVFEVTESDESLLKLTVISQGGEAFHGGDDVDALLAEACGDMIHAKTGHTRSHLSVENIVEVAARAREAKERLSGTTRFRIPFTFAVPPFVEQFSREDFHNLIAPFIDKTRKLVEKTLREAYTAPIHPDSISRVLLMGGSSQMPWVREMLLDIFSLEEKIYASEKPALDISLGAAYYAAMKMGATASRDVESNKFGDTPPEVEFDIAVPHDIGVEIETNGQKRFFPIIRRGTSYALAKKSHSFTLSGDDKTSLNLRLLERPGRDDPFEKCKLVGEVAISGIPETDKLTITLSVTESGTITGIVEDMTGTFKKQFDPDRFKTARVGS